MRMVAALSLPVCFACAPALVEEEGGPRGPLNVTDGLIVDAHGGTQLWRGVNLSQSAKSPPYVPAELEDPDLRAALRAHGPLTVRLVTSWAAAEPEDGTFDEAALARLAGVAQALRDDGHWIVVDLHQDLFGVGFTGGNGAPRFACAEAAYASFTYQEPWFLNYTSDEVRGCFDTLFGDDERLMQRMAAGLRRVVDAAVAGGGDAVVGVDLINEPHPGSRAPADFDARLDRYYAHAAAALEGTGLVLLFEPNVLHNMGEPTRLSTAPSASSAFAPHLYPVDAELGRYADQAAVAAAISHAHDEAAALAVPLVIGEYGPLLHDPARLTYVDDVLHELDLRFAGAFSWDFSAQSDRGLFREGANDVAVRELRPHARRVAGQPTSHAFSPRDAVLTLAFTETDATGATEVSWPTAWGSPDVVIDGVAAADAPEGAVMIAGQLVCVRHVVRGVGAAHELVVTRR